MKILIVEDNKPLADALKKIMEDEGFFADSVYDGEDALYYIKEEEYNLIILDIMLPRRDGISVLTQMRRAGINTPVLMLTAKSTVADKVKGLNTGADDYMAKPFDNEELVARVNALTRRKGDIILNEVKFSDLILNLSNATLYCGDSSIQLTKKEFETLKLLMTNNKATITKEKFIVNIWGEDSDVTENNVEAYISFIRKKLKFLKSDVKIKNVQGIGYRIESGNRM